MLPNNQVRVPSTRVVSQSTVSSDITDKFTTAASKLNTGQLVKDEYFTLFEAVGALEIMDSKMDSGYLGPGENQTQALEDDYDVTRELSAEEVLGVMDELLCYEMAWHKGHPLSQTLFTSLYLDKLLWPVPRTVEEARFDREKSNKEGSPLVNLVLRAYCLALTKACDFVHARISSEYYYEEEDFVTQLYNRTLLSQFDMINFVKLIDEALTWLDQQEGIIDGKLRDAIRCRLVLRRGLLYALDEEEDIRTKLTKHFASCLNQVPSLADSVSFGKRVPEAFSEKVQRKLASTVPPRPIVKINFEDALAHLKRLCQDAVNLQEILDYRGAHNLRVALWTLLSRKPQPSVYIRALTQIILMNGMTILGSTPVKDFLYDELSDLVLPSSILLQANTDQTEMPSDPRFQIAKHMDGFVKRFGQPFVDTYRSACLNRCRVRRTVCHTVVDWDQLQMEAEDLDEQLRSLSKEPPMPLPNGDSTYSYPLSSWTYHQKLCQFRHIIQLGFELSIYSPEELPGMYWYLSHICSTHLGHIDRIRTFIAATAKRNLSSIASKKPHALEQQAANKRSLRLLERLTTQIIAVDAFAISLHALYVLLARHNVLPTASSAQAYSSDRLRYELRMKPFLPISLPELVPYEEFHREAILDGDSDAVVLDRATRAISEARKAWEATLGHGAFLPDSQGQVSAAPAIEENWKREVKDTMRSCIGASIAIETVKKALGSSSGGGAGTEQRPADIRVEVPGVGSKARWHDWWIVPQVALK